jgi:hypothetical protein
MGLPNRNLGMLFQNPIAVSGARSVSGVSGSSWMASLLFESCINKRSRVRGLFTANNGFAAKKDADNFRCAIRQQPYHA